jgi:predicted transcriptional regulator
MTLKTKNVIRELRSMLPQRALNIIEARVVAEAQATTLLELLRIDQAPVDVGQIALLPRVRVDLLSDLPETSSSGISRWHGGWWVIQISRKIPLQRRRFSLAHEFKHVVDAGSAERVYETLGGGNPDEHEIRVEEIADYFAACLLMPRQFIVQAIKQGAGDVYSLALLFTVSPIAMKRRLHDLGFRVEPTLASLQEPAAQWFRARTEHVTSNGKEASHAEKECTNSCTA